MYCDLYGFILFGTSCVQAYFKYVSLFKGKHLFSEIRLKQIYIQRNALTTGLLAYAKERIFVCIHVWLETR